MIRMSCLAFALALTLPPTAMAVRDASGRWTLEFVQRMVSDIYFWPAIRNTLLLIC